MHTVMTSSAPAARPAIHASSAWSRISGRVPLPPGITRMSPGGAWEYWQTGTTSNPPRPAGRGETPTACTVKAAGLVCSPATLKTS